MLAELHQKSQITIPKEIVAKMGLSVGDVFDVREKDGAIYIVPVAVYPKKYIDDLLKEVEEMRARITSGEQETHKDVNSLFAALEND